MCLKVTIKALSPLSFSERKPGGIFQESLPYVPGATLRGSLAKAILDGRSHRLPHPEGEECEFCRIFLDQEAVIFTNAYPVQDPGEDVHVLPATAMSCKNSPGFRRGGDDTERHGVFDTLIDRLCWEALQPAALVYFPTCPRCHGRLDAFGGFYVQQGAQFQERKVVQRLLTRVAINRRRGVAEEGLLYSPYVISEVIKREKYPEDDNQSENSQNAQSKEEEKYGYTTFVGYVWEASGDLKDKLEKIDALGGRTSRGLGSVEIKAESTTGEGWEAVRDRIKRLDEAIETTWKQYDQLGSNDTPKEGIYFTIGLHSDAILRTTEGLPAMVVDEKMLEAATGIQVRLVRSFASYGYSGGWNTAWRLPKPAQVVTRRGSVYVFKVDEGPGEERYKALAKALAPLETKGIGQSRVEGYGQVRISDGFHLKRRE